MLNKNDHIKPSIKPRQRHTMVDSLMRYAEMLGYGDVHTKIDEKTGLKAIIAIHNLKRGPAIGGCRMVTYQTMGKAMEDALRLGYMMSYKAAINDLPHGGAKAVLLKPEKIHDREAYFQAVGNFVNELGGRYITAVDSGTSPLEMDIIAKCTPYVSCTTALGGDQTSTMTAQGVLRGIEAAVKFKMGRDSLEGIRVVIQGVGHVGYPLAKQLKEQGATLLIADTNINSLYQCADELNATILSPDAVYDVETDVFAPCALGAILNLDTIHRLKTKIIAGSANNQLAHHHYGALLQERGILYAPDFLINAGGLIHVAVIYAKGNEVIWNQKINSIYETVYEIFERAVAENRPTNDIAEMVAKKKLNE